LALKTISKAVSKQIGKTLTAMGESPEIRSLQQQGMKESRSPSTAIDKTFGNEQIEHGRSVKAEGKSLITQPTSKRPT
jgi:hypothetical protein